jgi:hypothetical protein
MDKVADILTDKDEFVSRVKQSLDAKAFDGIADMKKELASEFLKDIETNESE